VGTPTRPIRVATEITHPQTGDAASGITEIIGSALTTSYRYYEISLAPASSENWAWLATSFDIVSEDILYLLDTTAYPDGYYDLRLRTVRDDGNYEDAFLRGLEFRNANPPTPTPEFNELGTLVPPAPISPLETPTPTPRPRIVQNSPNGQGIFSPEVGQTVSGAVDIVGTANGSYQNPFSRYEMSISSAGDGNWQWLSTSTEQMWQGILYTLETRRFADGYYDIRQRIVYRDGNYDDFILRYMKIANQDIYQVVDEFPNGIYRPKSQSHVGGVVDFIGSAYDPEFLRWELHYSPSSAEQWTYLAGGDRQFVNEVFARLDLAKLGGTSADFRLRVVRQDYNYSEYFVRNLSVTPPTRTPLPPLPTMPPQATSTPLG
jgi:hypothetical protein